jgi:hypothetical protein
MHKPNPFPYDKAWIDQIGNFDYVDVITSMIINLVKRGDCGLYNVGTKLKSIYDLAKKTNIGVLPILSPQNAPKDITMDISKLKN